jgi:hypothetical protein
MHHLARSAHLLSIAWTRSAYTQHSIQHVVQCEEGAPQYTHIEADENALAKRWRTEGKTLGELALLMSSITPSASLWIPSQTTSLSFVFDNSPSLISNARMQQVVRPSPGAPAGASLTHFVATVATAVATAVATGPICVATVATAN